ncbi:MAG: hypothetical protein NTU81_03615 [Candidatus Nomurabacteria bacterium]|nr:hypothetical protein [Candidatus Nomurabacteria bacterium]
MKIKENITTKLTKSLGLFFDPSEIKLLHLQSTEGPLSYYFIFLGIDLEENQSYLDSKSLIKIMMETLNKEYGNDNQVNLEYQGTFKKLDEYIPNVMYLLETVLLNPYKEDEQKETRSYFAYKHYRRNCFYDWIHEVDWKERIDIVKVNDISFTPKKSLKTLLEINGFSKTIIPNIYILLNLY